MAESNQALKVALAAAEQLPLELQRQLVERLVVATAPDENTVVVYLQRLSPPKQTRLAELMDKNNEGRLSQAERLELKRLGAEVDQLLLANSQTLAHALRPELFDKRGRGESKVGHHMFFIWPPTDSPHRNEERRAGDHVPPRPDGESSQSAGGRTM